MNSLTYAAGDSILFHGGDSFTGCVMINSRNVPNKGSASNPITVDSYDSGNATLLSNCPGNLHALLTIDGVSGVTVQNLILSANGTQTAIGILIQNSIAGNTVDMVTIQNNDISGFNISRASNYGAEVFVSGFATNGNCGALNNIKVLNNKLHGAFGATSPDDNGITGHGCGQNITNVRYSGNEVYHIGGHATAPSGTSGNGILATGVAGGELSYNLVHDNGANTNTCGGPAGVWAYRSDHIIIQFNEVYNMRPVPDQGVGCDWAAYDLDEGVTNSIVQYNYSRNNAGAAWLVYNAAGPNTIRYNVSENDDAYLKNGGIAALNAGTFPLSFYNNTMFSPVVNTGTDNVQACFTFGFTGTFPVGTVIANNICSNSMVNRFGAAFFANAAVGVDTSAINFTHNLYENNSGGPLWQLDGVLYHSLAEIQAAGKEAGSIVANPMLTNAGAGGTCTWTPTIANGPQPCPSVYRLRPGSPALGVGANLTATPYNLDIGTRDYFGNTLGTSINVGADGGKQPRS